MIEAPEVEQIDLVVFAVNGTRYAADLSQVRRIDVDEPTESIGAPLGHDFCAISLSDNLKPWNVIEKRLIAAAEAGFVMAFYNPVSKARPHQLGQAFDILRAHLPGTVPVVFGRAAGRADERINVVPLSEAQSDMADMATCIIVGSTETRLIAREGRRPLVYSPRSWMAGKA